MSLLEPPAFDALPIEVTAELERAAATQGFASAMRSMLAHRPRILRALNDRELTTFSA